MNLLLTRLYDSGIDTAGILFYPTNKLRYVHTLEDTYRDIKIPGETRIAAGQYEIKQRKEGRIFENYCNHKNAIIAELTRKYGVLHLQDVPDYKYVLIHILNKAEQTEGCIGVGDKTNNFSKEPGFIQESTFAYIDLIRAVYPCFDRQERLYITILDYDRDIQNQFKV